MKGLNDLSRWLEEPSATDCAVDEDIADLVDLFEKRLHMPSYMRRCVVDVVNQGKTTDQAFAICQGTMQDVGYMTPGPDQKQLKKGKTRARHFSAKKDQSAYDTEYDDILKTSRAKTKLKHARQRAGFKGLADQLDVSLASTDALVEDAESDQKEFIDDIVGAITGDRKVSDKVRAQVREIVTKEVSKKNSELEEALALGVLTTSAVLSVIAASLLALAAVSVIAFVAATAQSANKAGIAKATKAASADAAAISEKATKKAKETEKEGEADAGDEPEKEAETDKGKAGLPSKKVDEPDIHEFRGKKGVWRTLKNGDRMFFPSDGSPPKGGAQTVKHSKKKKTKAEVDALEAAKKKNAANVKKGVKGVKMNYGIGMPKARITDAAKARAKG